MPVRSNLVTLSVISLPESIKYIASICLLSNSAVSISITGNVKFIFSAIVITVCLLQCLFTAFDWQYVLLKQMSIRHLLGFRPHLILTAHFKGSPKTELNFRMIFYFHCLNNKRSVPLRLKIGTPELSEDLS